MPVIQESKSVTDMAGHDNPLKRQMREFWRERVVLFSFFRGDWSRREGSVSKVTWLLGNELELEEQSDQVEGKAGESPMRK